MKIEASYLTSAVSPKGFLRTDKPIIAVAGQSNVGKSSFINLLAGRAKLARTSNTPGRTRMVNYFDFGPFVLADLPGYGFAKAGKAEREKWGKLMEAFFAEQGVAHVFSLFDIRHAPTKEDLQMVKYLYFYAIPFTAVATKADKLSRMKVKERTRAVALAFGLGVDNVIATSGTSGLGKDTLLARIAQICASAPAAKDLCPAAAEEEDDGTEEGADAESEA